MGVMGLYKLLIAHSLGRISIFIFDPHSATIDSIVHYTCMNVLTILTCFLFLEMQQYSKNKPLIHEYAQVELDHIFHLKVYISQANYRV